VGRRGSIRSRGFASCRSAGGTWTAPAGTKIEGGSFGLQVGGAESDIVIFVMNKSGMEKLLKSSLCWVATIPRLPAL
jgi:lipid-binding SYLF domain-containing protein